MRIVYAASCFVVATCIVLWIPDEATATQSRFVHPTSLARGTAELPEPVVQAGHSATITVLLASPQSGLLASGSKDGTVKVWSLRTGELLNTIAVSRAWVRSLAFSGDGKQIAVGAGDHVAYTYDALSGILLHRFVGADSAITAVAFSSDGLMLAAGTSRDDVVRVWLVDSGEMYVDIRNKPPVRALAFERTSNVLFMANADHTSRLRIGLGGRVKELQSKYEQPKIAGVASPALVKTSQDKPFAVDASGRMIAFAEGRTIAWSLTTGGLPKPSPAFAPPGVRAIRLSPDDRTLVLSTNMGDVAIWDLVFGEMTHFLPDAAAVSTAFSNAIAFSKDGTTIMTAKDEHRARWSWKLSLLNPPPLPVRRGETIDSSRETILESGEDIGGPGPIQPPGNLRIMGQPNILTHSAAMSPASERVIYAGMFYPDGTSGSPFVSAENAITGEQLWTVHLSKDKVNRATAVAVVPDGSAVAVAFDDRSIDWIDGSTGRVQKTMLSSTDRAITILEFSKQGNLLAGGTEDGEVQIWNTEGQSLPTPSGHRARILALSFSSDGQTLASGGADNVINIWDVQRNAWVRTLTGHSSAVTALAYAHDRAVLVSGSEDSTIKIWNSTNGQLLATASSLGSGTWLVMSPEGFFDGTRQSWNAVPFRFRSAPDRFYRPEQFFTQFFQPGLLAEVVDRQISILDLLREQHDKRAELNVALYMRSQLPTVQVEVLQSVGPVATRTIQIKISATDRGSGLRDLRIFRNQSLVKFIHGDLKVDSATRRYAVSIPVEVTAGSNEISAYAFNRDNLKSEDAVVNVVGAEALKRKGSAYVIAVGVNHYVNPEFDLRFAAPDARLIDRELTASLKAVGTYADVVSVTLSNEEATKRNVLQALQRLVGEKPKLAPPVSKRLERLQRANPEDVIVIYFAGHGATAGDRYYLLPHDVGYLGSKQQITPHAWKTILANAISDRDLNDVLERIDSAQIMLVIDACQSGRILDSEESRRGPLNARGIAQLAYEKGAYVLVAAQSNQAALELERFGHGVLTYTLIEKGLHTFGADGDADGRVTVREWFRYASDQVPREIATLTEERSASGRLVTVGGEPVTVQRPRSYFRRDRADDWLIANRGK